MRTPRVLTHTEGNTRPSDLARRGRSAGVLRPWHAGREASKHLGGPSRSCFQAGGGVLSQGKPAGCGWGVVSSVVLGGGESPLPGEGLDGSTQPTKATHPGHVGPDQYEPTSLWGIANRMWPKTNMACAEASATEEPDAGKPHVRVCTGGPGNRR